MAFNDDKNKVIVYDVMRQPLNYAVSVLRRPNFMFLSWQFLFSILPCVVCSFIHIWYDCRIQFKYTSLIKINEKKNIKNYTKLRYGSDNRGRTYQKCLHKVLTILYTHSHKYSIPLWRSHCFVHTCFRWL